MSKWTEAAIPPQRGRVAVVTGANGGLGAETARALAHRGAHVVLACRTVAKGESVADRIRTDHPDALVEVRALDLADLSSVQGFAAGVRADFSAVDLLILNAGIMAIPRRTTADGFEMQLGTNHIGHFALTSALLGAVARSAAGRVVAVASQAHRMGWMRWHDPMGEQRYERWTTYGQSKLANLLFAFELDRRLRATGSAVQALAAHPGYASTNLQHVGPAMDGSAVSAKAMALSNQLFSQSAAMGALPTLRAATDPEAKGGEYYGPDGFWEMQGWPVPVGASERARDQVDAARLWRESEGWVGAPFDVAAALAGDVADRVAPAIESAQPAAR